MGSQRGAGLKRGIATHLWRKEANTKSDVRIVNTKRVECFQKAEDKEASAQVTHTIHPLTLHDRLGWKSSFLVKPRYGDPG